MRVMKFIIPALLVVSISAFVVAQQPAQTSPTVKHVPITNTPSNSGKGDVQQLLRRLPWKRRQGQRASGLGHEDSADRPGALGAEEWREISGGTRRGGDPAGKPMTPSHGSQEMPVWGPLFSSISQGHECQVQQRITNLVSYIEALQGEVGHGFQTEMRNSGARITRSGSQLSDFAG